MKCCQERDTPARSKSGAYAKPLSASVYRMVGTIGGWLCPRISPMSALSRVNPDLHKASRLNFWKVRSPEVLTLAPPFFSKKCGNPLVLQVSSQLPYGIVPPSPGSSGWLDKVKPYKRGSNQQKWYYLWIPKILTKSSARACSPCARRLFFKSFTLFKWSSWFWICS